MVKSPWLHRQINAENDPNLPGTWRRSTSPPCTACTSWEGPPRRRIRRSSCRTPTAACPPSRCSRTARTWVSSSLVSWRDLKAETCRFWENMSKYFPIRGFFYYNWYLFKSAMDQVTDLYNEHIWKLTDSHMALFIPQSAEGAHFLWLGSFYGMHVLRHFVSPHVFAYPCI